MAADDDALMMMGRLFGAKLEILKEIIVEQNLEAGDTELTRPAAVGIVTTWFKKELETPDKGKTAMVALEMNFATPKVTVQKKEIKAESSDLLSLPFRKEFKINGTIGDNKNCIGYLSFLRHLNSGLKSGYSEQELVDGVIRAIQAGSRLRGYLEGCGDLSVSKLQGVVRAFYREKSATELYQELCNLKQTENESVQNFIFRALELRQKLIFTSNESSQMKYDEELVERSFRHSVSTGIRDEQIRVECHNLLKSYITDESLIEGVNDIVRRADETKAKLCVKTKVNSVTEESSVLQELKNLRTELNELKINKQQEQNQTQRKPTKRKTCANCGPSDRCYHCWNCGSSDHLKRKCPENGQRLPNRSDW